jgi:glutaredoxin 3
MVSRIEGPAARCGVHDLTVDPEGQCVICRSDLAGADAARGLWRTAGLLAIGVGLVALVAVGASRGAASAQAAAASSSEVAVTEVTEPPEPRSPRPGRPPPEAEPQRGPRDAPAAEPPRAPGAQAPAPAGATAAEVQAEMKRVPIVLYSASWCPHCKSAKRWLDDNGYAYTQHDIEDDAGAAREHRARNPKGSVPTLVIGDAVQVGFSAPAVIGAIERSARQRLTAR